MNAIIIGKRSISTSRAVQEDMHAINIAFILYEKWIKEENIIFYMTQAISNCTYFNMDQPELNHIERTSTTTIIYAQQTINDIGDSLEKNATVMSPFNSEITAITIFSSLFICAVFCCIFLYIKSKQIMSSQSSKQPQIISNQIPDNKPRSPSIMIHTYLQSQGITDITQHNASDLIEVIISSSDENENTDPNRKHIVHGSREDNIQKITVTKTECGGNIKHETVNNILKNIKDEKKDNKLMEVMLEDILNKKSVSEDSDDIYDKPENDNVFINDISVISPLKITVSQCEGNMKLNKYLKNENDINICDEKIEHIKLENVLSEGNKGTNTKMDEFEPNEDVLLDEMLSDILEMKHLDPNKIHEMNVKNVINGKNNESDSDDSDNMYQ